MISAVILTKNEEKNIKECLDGLRWCDEILVIDDNSTDETMKMAEEHKARAIRRSLNGNFAQQRNFGLEKASGEWIFFVDADEKVSVNLAKEIQRVTHDSTIVKQRVNGFYFKRIDWFAGGWLKHGEVGGIGGVGGVKILRLARKDAGKWVRCVDEKWEVKGKTKILKNPLLHYSHPNLTDFLTSINERSTLNAKEFYKEGRRLTLIEWFKPLAKFTQNYFLRLGFLDGSAGFVFAVLMSFHSFLVRGKLYLLIRREQKDKVDKMEKKGEIGKLLFLIWVIFVFASYIYFLFQRGISKWWSWRF